MWRLALALIVVPCAGFAQGASEVALVKAMFAKLQPVSIEKNREYCGYVGFDADGRMRASKPARGDTDSCMPDDPELIEVITASYHTHGAYSPDYYNEVPSGDDMESDEAEGIDGWVATPGGRLWYIDTDTMTASQYCGIGCLPSDPKFVPGDMGKIAPSYSYDDLVRVLE